MVHEHPMVPLRALPMQIRAMDISGQCVGMIMDNPKRDSFIQKHHYDVCVCVFYLCYQSLFNDDIAVRP